MSRDAKIDLDFADGTYSFRLAWGELIKLQEERDCGPGHVLNRLASDTWHVQDISAVIRLGLIGGGMHSSEALKKVRTYVESEPPLNHLALAQTILIVGLNGAPDEEAGKKSAAASPEEMTHSPMEKSGLPPSMETVLS